MARFAGLAGVAAHANAATVPDDLLLVATGADGPGPDAVWVRRRTGSGWSGWSAIGQPAGGAVGCRPAVARDASGAHVIVVLGQDGAVWSTREDPTGAAAHRRRRWPAQGVRGRQRPVRVAHRATSARSSLAALGAPGPPRRGQRRHGRAAGRGVQRRRRLGLVHHRHRGYGPAPPAADAEPRLSDRESLGSPAAGLDGTGLGVTRISDGRLELFMAASDGGVWHRWQNKGGPGWAAWAPLGQPSQGGHQHQLADLAVAQDRASGLVLYATETVMLPAPSGSPWLWLRTQWAEGAPWIKWDQLRLTTGSTTRQLDGPMLTAYGNQLVLVLRETGTADIFVVTQGPGDPSDLTGWHVEYLKF